MFMFIQMRVRVYMNHLCILVCADDIQACACIDVWFVRVTL